MSERTECPSGWAIEQSLLGEASAEVQAHLDGCERCQAELTTRREQGRDYMTSEAANALRRQFAGAHATCEAPPPSRAVSGAPSRGASAAFGWAALAIAAAVGALFLGPLAAPDTPSAGERLAVKGNAPQLTLWLGEEGTEAAELRSEDTDKAPQTKAGARIQPALALPSSRQVALFVLSPGGQVATLLPESDARSHSLPARGSLPIGPSFRVDDEAGLYRVLAFIDKRPFDITGITTALRENAPPAFAGVILERSFRVNPE
jgi:hypothetical protein